MELSFGVIVTFVGVLLLAGVLSNKLSSKFNMPILLLFLAVGMTVGAHGLGIVHLEPEKHAGPINSLGTVAMCFILFAGGLGTSFRSIRPVIRSGVTLATAGVVLTAIFLGICGYLICLAFNHNTGFAWWMLMASIISSTDAAAMFAILRGNGVNLSGDLQPLLELESGSNDPMAALLTLVMLQIVTVSSGFSFWQIPLLFYKIIVG
ncbi:MAG: cation:proton antiporter, partial [Lentisphaeria bacterium]|nr:cation:proton antiporter [Lentisphaeria bacterium]